ncbi:helix-turn-helix domain-containing protein [Acuticoccus kandeliae]|uniref:helix-turn-helix domain-containing protein n=1 Tax=Acuticoccus kandeliae TaxID=2073160 RepID=UPI000D3EBD69|nr:helix-turn-helix transcriptional regulator [Acuticoccus kandeliae]
MSEAPQSVGVLLKGWRQRRRVSQLVLAADAEVSQRHLSFVETGRATPSRAMLLRLAERLDVPLRAQNALLLAAGYAPTFRDEALEGAALDLTAQVQAILDGHAPNPAIAVDRHWTLTAHNAVAARLFASADPSLLTPPVNVLRLSLAPGGIGTHIANYREWRAHLVHRVAREVERAADPVLATLLAELRTYPVPPGARPYRANAEEEKRALTVPLELATAHGTLRLISTTTVFGTATDVTLSELALECFYPMDRESGAILRTLAEASAGPPAAG